MLCFNYITYSQITGLILNKLNYKDGTAQIINQDLSLFRPYYFQKSIMVKKSSPTFKSPYRYLDELGFFCKVELRWDKKLAKPFRFRLGSYDYVNRLEGK